MSVAATNSSDGPFAPNGSTKTFPFTFAAMSSAEIQVVRRSPDGTETALTGYTVALTGHLGGTVTFSFAPAAGDPIYILSDPSFEQQTDFTNQGAYAPSTINKINDRHAARAIYLRNEVDRSLKVPRGDGGDLVVPPASVRKGGFFAFDAVGDPIVSCGTGADSGLRADLADGGASLVGVSGGGTVQSVLTEASQNATLALGLIGLGSVPNIEGAPTVGAVLTAPPFWSLYQWEANGVPIPGATSSTYTLTANEAGKTMRLGLGLGIGFGLRTGAVGPVTATLPTGALGAWYADTYSATPRANVPNAVAAAPVSLSVGPPARRAFSLTDFYEKSGVTVTDNAATARDGSTTASSFSGTGNWYLRDFSAVVAQSFAAGAWTFCFDYKRNAGTDQTFRGAWDADDGPLTATSTWQRAVITKTLTAGAHQAYIRAITGGGAADILIDNYHIFPGSADLMPNGETLDGHMYLGQNKSDTRPTYASGLVDFSNSGYGFIQLGTAANLSAFTVIQCVKKVAAGSALQGLLSKIQSYAQFTPYISNSDAPQVAFNGTLTPYPVQGPGLWIRQNSDLLVQTHVWDGSTLKTYLNDELIVSTAFTSAAVALADIYSGRLGASYTGAKWGFIGLWARALSDTERLQAFAHVKLRMATTSNTVKNITRYYMPEGDSITCTRSDTFAYTYGAVANPAVYGGVLAVSGSTLASMAARASADDARVASGKTFIMSVLIGANDLATYPGASDAAAAASYLTALASYCDARRAAGWKVVLCTILPRGDSATHNTRRNIINPTIRTWAGVHCDAVADFAGDSIMGIDSSFSTSPSYWQDAIHPGATGHVRLLSIIQPILDAIT